MKAKQIWSNTKFVGRCAREAGMQVTTIVVGGVSAAVAGVAVGTVAAIDTYVDVSRMTARACKQRLDHFVEREKLHLGSPLSNVVASY